MWALFEHRSVARMSRHHVFHAAASQEEEEAFWFHCWPAVWILVPFFSSAKLALCLKPLRCKSQEGDKLAPCPAGVVRVSSASAGDSCWGTDQARIL